VAPAQPWVPQQQALREFYRAVAAFVDKANPACPFRLPDLHAEPLGQPDLNSRAANPVVLKPGRFHISGRAVSSWGRRCFTSRQFVRG
jgi:hypothetical protein